jgi:hypothetical protein
MDAAGRMQGPTVGRQGAGVGTLVVAMVALVAAILAVSVVKRRAARRAAEARERARRRRRRMPEVSANVRGLPRGDEQDMWASEAPVREDRVA